MANKLTDLYTQLKSTIVGTKTQKTDDELDTAVKDIISYKSHSGRNGYIDLVRTVIAKSATGVGFGGGSLVYANTLPRPKKQFFNSGNWAGIADWEKELEPHYQTAEKMLGVAENPRLFDSDFTLNTVAEQLGREEEFERTKVAVFFGEADKTVPDPFFNGEGPDRKGCTQCGACMTGCRHDAKR